MESTETIRFLDSLGCKFSRAGRNRYAKVGVDERMRPSHSYLDTPLEARDAIRHLNRGGNVGVLPEHSGDICVVDVDAGLASASTRLSLGEAPLVHRTNAPDRGKYIVRVAGDKRRLPYLAQTPDFKIEFIALRRHAIVAGTHDSGCPIVTESGTPPVLEVESLKTMFESRPVLPRVPVIAHDAIDRWCADPVNQAEVDRLLAGKRWSGKYVAIRDDDKHPSVREFVGRNGKRLWRDFGSQETLDVLEMYVRLTGCDKRELIRQITSR